MGSNSYTDFYYSSATSSSPERLSYSWPHYPAGTGNIMYAEAISQKLQDPKNPKPVMLNFKHVMSQVRWEIRNAGDKKIVIDRMSYYNINVKGNFYVNKPKEATITGPRIEWRPHTASNKSVLSNKNWQVPDTFTEVPYSYDTSTLIVPQTFQKSSGNNWCIAFNYTISNDDGTETTGQTYVPLVVGDFDTVEIGKGYFYRYEITGVNADNSLIGTLTMDRTYNLD